MKRIIAIGICILYAACCELVLAQELPEYTAYANNPVTLNPAFTGIQGTSSLYASYRSQWVGLEGAPKTGMFSFETIFGKNNGVAVYGLQDEIGVTSTTEIGFSYSHDLQLNRWNSLNLKLGISGSGQFRNVYYDALSRRDPDNELSGELSEFEPNVGIGAVLYSEKFYVGFSIPRLFEMEYYDDIKESMLTKNMQMYLIGGYIFELSYMWKMKPALLLKYRDFAPFAINISMNMLWNDKLSFGVNYRNNNTLSALFGFNLTEKTMIGYAYDRYLEPFGRYDNSSHEIYIRFNFSLKPRFCWCTN